MSCHWHNFHTTEFTIFMTYNEVQTQAMNISSITTQLHKWQVQLDNDDGTL